MPVEITVKVNGQVVREHVEQVSGTLEDMEGKIDAMSRQVASAALQASVDARLAGEQSRVMEWFIGGVRKLDALIQRYATQDQIVRYTGENGAQRYAVWNRQTIQGRWAYAIKPDTQLRQDAAYQRKQTLDLYNLTTQDPAINIPELLRMLVQRWNLDPAKMIVHPQPPGPPPPNVSVRVTMDDLAGPAGPIAIEILMQAGYKITPDAVSSPPLPAPLLEEGAERLLDRAGAALHRSSRRR